MDTERRGGVMTWERAVARLVVGVVVLVAAVPVLVAVLVAVVAVPWHVAALAAVLFCDE